MASTPTTLYDFAAQLLDVCEQALATTAAGVPDRSYVTVDSPALDCPDQLTVHTSTLQIDAQGPPMGVGQRIKMNYRILDTIVATIVRCTPQSLGNGAPPSTVALDQLAQTVNEDLWVIWNHVTKLIRDGALFEGVCQYNDFDVARAQRESGTSAGWVFTVRVAIDGFTVIP
jgi:hypothetical protein